MKFQIVKVIFFVTTILEANKINTSLKTIKMIYMINMINNNTNLITVKI